MDIYVSYARIDDADKTIRSIVARLEQLVAIMIGDSSKKFFMDFKDVEAGERWVTRIENEVESTYLCLACLSPSYFKSDYCLEEWDAYNLKCKRNNKDLIIPVIVWPMEGDDQGLNSAQRLDTEQMNRYQESRRMQQLDLWSVRHDAVARERLLENVAGLICKRLATDDREKANVRNTHEFKPGIDELAAVERLSDFHKKIVSEPRSFPGTSPVCVIYTGGTVGMIREEDFNRDSVLTMGGVDDLRKHVRKMTELKFDIDFFSYSVPIDSSNIDSRDWMMLAKIIKNLYDFYQGFVILHGTNTLAYTASALSFILGKGLRKPIVLTGAEIPLIEIHSDAETNILRALEIAAPEVDGSPGNVPEVCIVFGNHLLRGNRATKWDSLDTYTGFASPNYPPLGTITHNKISLNYRDIYKPIQDDEFLQLEIATRIQKDGVFIFEVYPDMDLSYYKPALIDQTLKGIIVKTYGTGNAPDVPKELLNLLETAVKKGVIVVNLTQCPKGFAQLRLFETNAKLFDIGVINGGDMKPEAAYCKLKCLLGKYDSSDEKGRAMIKREMQIDLRGELSLSAFQIEYSKETEAIADPIFRGPPIDIGHFRFDPMDIDRAFMRIQGIQLINAEEDVQLEFRSYYNRRDVGIPETLDDSHHRVGSFFRQISPDEVISHNLEITDRFRRLVRTNDFSTSIQVLTKSGAWFRFESLKLVIFTRP